MDINTKLKDAVLDIIKTDILLNKNLYKSKQIELLYSSKYNIDSNQFEYDTKEYQYYLDSITAEDKEELYLKWALDNISKVMSHKIFYKVSDFKKKCTNFGDVVCTGNSNNWIAFNMNTLYSTNEGDLLNRIICAYLPKYAAKGDFVGIFPEYWSEDLIWNLDYKTNGGYDASTIAYEFYKHTHK